MSTSTLSPLSSPRWLALVCFLLSLLTCLTAAPSRATTLPPSELASPVDTTRPSHARPQRSEDGRLGGAGRAQAEGRARNRVGIQGDGNVPLHEWVECAPDAVDEDFARKPQQDDAVAANEKALKALLAGRPVNGPPGVDNSGQKQAAAAGSAEAPVTWLFEPESFAPLAKLVSGEQYGIVTDHLGTPVGMFDAAGREMWGADIDAYGDLRNVRGERQACPFRWPGQYEDEDTGLNYSRFRYYAPLVGAFVSSDPLGPIGGLPLFAYVKDPLRGLDPLGLSECVKKGEPLPGDALVHRIGGAAPENLRLKPPEKKLSPPGISMLRTGSPEEASALGKQVANKEGWTRMATSSETIGSATVADIRGAGFDVIHDPTGNFGDSHARLTHPEGATGFTPENLAKLADVFSNKGGL